jgi:hypothetical protein
VARAMRALGGRDVHAAYDKVFGYLTGEAL